MRSVADQQVRDPVEHLRVVRSDRQMPVRAFGVIELLAEVAPERPLHECEVARPRAGQAQQQEGHLPRGHRLDTARECVLEGRRKAVESFHDVSDLDPPGRAGAVSGRVEHGGQSSTEHPVLEVDGCEGRHVHRRDLGRDEFPRERWDRRDRRRGHHRRRPSSGGESGVEVGAPAVGGRAERVCDREPLRARQFEDRVGDGPARWLRPGSERVVRVDHGHDGVDTRGPAGEPEGALRRGVRHLPVDVRAARQVHLKCAAAVTAREQDDDEARSRSASDESGDEGEEVFGRVGLHDVGHAASFGRIRVRLSGRCHGCGADAVEAALCSVVAAE
jgi:hypothetical protein